MHHTMLWMMILDWKDAVESKKNDAVESEKYTQDIDDDSAFVRDDGSAFVRNDSKLPKLSSFWSSLKNNKSGRTKYR